MRRLTATRRGPLVAFAAAAAVGVACSWWAATGGPLLIAGWRLLLVLGAWAVAWLVAVFIAFRLPARLAVTLVVLAAVAMRLAALGGAPTTSDDLYRYAWDGRVQASGADPYANAPLAPQLTALRDGWLWPDARGCAALDRPPGCTRINRPDARTIYPPVAEAWFGAVNGAAGGHRHKTWQAAGLATDLAVIALLLVALKRWRRDMRWVALYALCPAPVFEFVQNGHVDGLAVALLLAAFVVALPPPRAQVTGSTAVRDVAVGLLIGAAALVKLYPALLLVVVVTLPRPRPWLSLGRAAVAAALLAVLTYLPHVLSVGVRVVGYLPGYLREEHYDGGGRFLLAGALGLSGTAATVAAGASLVLALAWVVWRRPEAPRAAAVVLVVLFLSATPVQPWYAVSALAVASLAGWPAPAAVVAAGYPYYFAVILDFRHTVGLGRVSYGAAFIAVVAASVRTWALRGPHRRQVERSAAVEAPVSGWSVPRGEHGPARSFGVDESLQPAGRSLSGGGGEHRS